MMLDRRKLLIFIISVLCYSLVRFDSVSAQIVDNRWSTPIRLSTKGSVSSEGFPVSDQFGFVHLFWFETGITPYQSTLQYSRFDGINWTPPNDIFIIPADSRFAQISPFTDQDGVLHLAWVDSPQGPIKYSRALSNDALSSRSWQPPTIINQPASEVKMAVDSDGIIHIIFSTIIAEQPGLYYLRSKDQGATWQEPIWLDPDIKNDTAPSSISFSIDDSDQLHVVWYYTSLVAQDDDWIRYLNSKDGGKTWSSPVTIDQDWDNSGRLYFGDPIMITIGQSIHVIWASDLKRMYRFSKDGGDTWSAPLRVMEDLEGQAFDGMAVDGADRVHFFGQIRYPQGIYHSYLIDNGWTYPNLIYLLARTHEESIGDRIHAHDLNPTVRAGNQIILTFANEPGNPERSLYYITRTLEDIPQNTPEPLSTPVITQNSLGNQKQNRITLPTSTEIISPTIHISEHLDPDYNPNPSSSIWITSVPSILIIVGIILYRYLRTR